MQWVLVGSVRLKLDITKSVIPVSYTHLEQKKKAFAALIFEGVEDSFESSKCYE